MLLSQGRKQAGFCNQKSGKNHDNYNLQQTILRTMQSNI